MEDDTHIIDMIEQCGETAKAKGFWDSHKLRAAKTLKQLGYPPDTAARILTALEDDLLLGDPATFMALVVSELGEGIEAYRRGNYTCKDGVAEELADAVIRIFDFVARFGPRLGFTKEDWVRILRSKMDFNKTRPPLHDKGF